MLRKADRQLEKDLETIPCGRKDTIISVMQKWMKKRFVVRTPIKKTTEFYDPAFGSYKISVNPETYDNIIPRRDDPVISVRSHHKIMRENPKTKKFAWIQQTRGLGWAGKIRNVNTNKKTATIEWEDPEK